MNINRRTLLKSTAAAAAAGAFPSHAWAEDPISVASIHDLSGGLDIYGKPMIATLDFAIDELNAGGGLLGRQIELINYDPQSNIQLYTQFATQAATNAALRLSWSKSSRAITPCGTRHCTIFLIALTGSLIHCKVRAVVTRS